MITFFALVLKIPKLTFDTKFDKNCDFFKDSLVKSIHVYCIY